MKKTLTTMVICMLFVASDLPAQCLSCEECNYVIEPGDDSNFNKQNQGELYDSLVAVLGGTFAGKTICLKAGVYDQLVYFDSLQGTSSNPVTLTNCGGQVVFDSDSENRAIDLRTPRYVKLLGNGCPDEAFYGIRAAMEGNIIHVDGKFRDIEVAYLNVGGDSGLKGSAGIKLKDEPNCDNDTLPRGHDDRWVIRNIYVHDNYVHNVGTEGFYIGKGDNWYDDGKTPVGGCSTVAYSNSMKNVHVYNNITDSTGWDGLQVKDADSALFIHNNVIINSGIINQGGQNEGLFVGTSVGEIYQNKIINGTSVGFRFKGHWQLNFYNNLIANFGDHAIELNGSQDTFNEYIRIFNNTMVGSGNSNNDAIKANNYGELDEFIFVNNILSEPRDGADFFGFNTNHFSEYSNNIIVEDASTIGFVEYSESSWQDFLENDYRLTENSIAIDSGMNTNAYGADSAAYDYLGNARGYNSVYDIGAYEFIGEEPDDPDTTLWSYFINTGGFEHVENDTIWNEDRNSTQNSPYLDTDYSTNDTGGTSSFGGTNNTNAPTEVLGTYRYESGSNDTIKYDVLLPEPGEDYEVTLYFATKNADDFGSGDRRFDIIIEGDTKTTYDIYDNIGDQGNSAGSVSYTVENADDSLTIIIAAVSGSQAQINALSFEQLSGSGSGDPDPPVESSDTIFVNSGGWDFISGDTLWAQDKQTAPHEYLDDTYNSFTTGSEGSFHNTNNTNAPREILGSYRYTSGSNDTIKYKIPVTGSGEYDIELYFAFKNGDSFISGDRYFNILAEGSVVTSYDIYDEAGYDASSFAFSSSVSDDTLNLTFAALSGGEAQINAIRIVGPVSSGARHNSEEEHLTTGSPSLKIYPNPAYETLNFVLPPNAGSYFVQVIDLSGRIHIDKNISSDNGKNQKIDIRSIPDQQIYLLKVKFATGSTRTYKFMKK